MSLCYKPALRALACLCLSLLSIPAFAQQTGIISGKVTGPDGATLPGVTVEARSTVLPSARVTVTADSGDYRLPALPPGEYTLKFTLSGMATATRTAQAQLGQETAVDVKLALAGVTETVSVTATATLVERDSTAIKSTLSYDDMKSLPVGQEYRDLIKLIPGVMYSQDSVRGPSAGASGQDNVYQFDGVNVTLPLFGTLSAEPASHDIAQITSVKGGAKAVDFDRAGGFSVDSVSKSGTSRYSGMASYQFQTNGMSADLKNGSLSRYEQNRSWINFNLGGPVIKDRAFFYASYYRPENSRDNRSNLYGSLPRYESARNEGFIKGTFTPLSSVLLNVSYRDSHRLGTQSSLFGSTSAVTTGAGSESWLKIGTADGSWIIDSRSFVTMKFTNFINRTQSRPDFESSAVVSTDIGTRLDITNLDQQGLFTVPAPIAGQTAYNTFIAPLVTKYGYADPTTGAQTGGGLVGFSSLFDKDDFFRTSGQVGYNINLRTGSLVHDIHAGYQQYIDAEELTRRSNGWGSITVPGGRLAPPAGTTQPAFFQAAFQQQALPNVPRTIRSEYHSQSLEFNDNIKIRNWAFNVGLLMSHDGLYGQGLQNDASTLSGFVLATGTTPESRRYKMYDIPFSKQLQPRVGATWAYDGKNSVFASYAKYVPAASSLPRAASWDRNLATTIQANFDANGVLFNIAPVASSSGKLFVPDMTPRTFNEGLFGTSRQFGNHLTGRLYARIRNGSHFWEDTNNNARSAFKAPATLHGVSVPQTDYIPNLTDQRVQIGNGVANGSTYVITELDGAYTKFREVTMESEYRASKVFVRGSYTWSHYYGNFDQDNTTGAENDANLFIGSSNVGDGAGRQLWDNKDGNLRGDRRHMFKAYGSYSLNWNATAGAYFIAQSGQPWQAESFEPYIALTTNTSDSNRNAEPAGSRLTKPHYQLDLNYTQNVRLHGRQSAQVILELFNIANKQTGYNIQPSVHSAAFGIARSFYDPRRFQVTFKFTF